MFSIQKLADLPFYTEGPAIDSEGNFYCTTLSGGSILKVDTQGKITEWAKSVCPNGQIILPDGDHLVCDSKLGVVVRFDAKGQFLKNETPKILSEVEVFVPNDLIVDKNGNLYFTDSIRHTGKVCYLGHDGQEAIIADNLDYPNGLIFSHDEQTLYVAESYKNRILKLNIPKAGKMEGNVAVFANLPTNTEGGYNLPDGLALNTNGDIVVAHYGMQAIQMLDKHGELLFSIDTTLPLTSNVIFLNETTLLVTGGYGEPGPGALFKIELNFTLAF